jgi:hypothetical protein
MSGHYPTGYNPQPFSHAHIQAIRSTHHDPTMEGIATGLGVGALSIVGGTAASYVAASDATLAKTMTPHINQAKEFAKTGPDTGMFKKAGHAFQTAGSYAKRSALGFGDLIKHAGGTGKGKLAMGITAAAATTLGIGAGAMKAHSVNAQNQEQMDLMMNHSLYSGYGYGYA